MRTNRTILGHPLDTEGGGSTSRGAAPITNTLPYPKLDDPVTVDGAWTGFLGEITSSDSIRNSIYALRNISLRNSTSFQVAFSGDYGTASSSPGIFVRRRVQNSLTVWREISLAPPPSPIWIGTVPVTSTLYIASSPNNRDLKGISVCVSNASYATGFTLPFEPLGSPPWTAQMNTVVIDKDVPNGIAITKYSVLVTFALTSTTPQFREVTKINIRPMITLELKNGQTVSAVAVANLSVTAIWGF